MRITICLVAFLATMLVFSCKKKTNGTIPTPIDTVVTVTYPDYTAMKPGNYWIYQRYSLDSANGVPHALGTYDSCYVEKDTTINGKTYHKYIEADPNSLPSSPTYLAHFLKDSLSYTIDNHGAILFSSSNFKDTLRIRYSYPSAAHPDTIKVVELMGFRDAAITVDAGTFVTSTLRQLWLLPPSLPYGPVREIDVAYAKNIGIIKQGSGFYISAPNTYERRLHRYHLQ